MRLAALAGIALLVAACGSAPVAVAVTRGPSAPTHDVVALLVGGIEEPLVPGAAVPLAGDLVAQVTLRPGDDGSAAKILDVALTRGGRAVPGATIGAIGHMRYMDHGAFAVAAIPDGDGRYVLALPFAMSGEWEVDLAIATDGTTVGMPLALSVIR